MEQFHLVAENTHSTVISEYIPDPDRPTEYQSEAELECEFIRQLQAQGYEYLNSIHTEAALIANLRTQIEKLNDYTFSDNEWRQFFESEIANKNHGIIEKTRTIQQDEIKILHTDDGLTKNIFLINKKHIHKNSLQVINQYTTDWGSRKNRYDVTILVNGLPMIHLELKRRWVSLMDAFNQIDGYQNESFWSGSGLYEYIQLFVISNGTRTKYYSNTTRQYHIEEMFGKNQKKTRKTSNSFEFTSWWADAKNKAITDLVDFTKTFFARHTILNILTKYCVFNAESMLMVMRPYQIVATERIINKIELAKNSKKMWTIDAGGYIWHTTGSGKTLTSFKTAQLASKIDYVDKVLFVVDRKDLDTQTMREYDRFQRGAANSTLNTRELERALSDSSKKIIITTIQKLSNFVKKYNNHVVFYQHVVMIFDECHRSQFGDMHRDIIKNFKQYNLFGFTGTPIFVQNSTAGKFPTIRTTEQLFGKCLHIYSIVDAIGDKNVLPFKVDYVSTFHGTENIENKAVESIETEEALAHPERLKNIVKYILEHFDQKTQRNDHYTLKDRRMRGFNSIFAVSSIDLAKKYYYEFKRRLAWQPSDKQLKIATIFSFGPTNFGADELDDENPENTTELSISHRDFLDQAIADYNEMFGQNFDTRSGFANYYQDINLRTRNREIDILLVVNMFLTGFDAPTMNTLWVDKNLQHQGLLQAYSRTNRILNRVKTFGNIVCFRNLEQATNEAIALFANRESRETILIRPFKDYYEGYIEDGKSIEWYSQKIEKLQQSFSSLELIIEEKRKEDFVKLYGEILRLKNILSAFDEFDNKKILSDREFQDYQSMYIDIYTERRLHQTKKEKESIVDDLVFEIELIKQIEINIDYILQLIRNYQASQQKDLNILEDIRRTMNASIELRNKKDLIEDFIAKLSPHDAVDEEWEKYVQIHKKQDIDAIIESERLNSEKVYQFMENAFRDGGIPDTGESVSAILPKISLFDKSNTRAQKRESILGKLKEFFDKYFSISSRFLKKE